MRDPWEHREPKETTEGVQKSNERDVKFETPYRRSRGNYWYRASQTSSSSGLTQEQREDVDNVPDDNAQRRACGVL